MTRLRLILATGCLTLATVWCLGQAPPAKVELLPVSKGLIPTDTGSDGATKMTIENHPDFSGKALKVVMAKKDTFGDRVARVKSWKPYAALQFDAVNPSKEDIKLVLNIFHKRTTNYPTRVVHPVVLKPGKNSIRIGIDELANVNGSAPDLTNITKWYFSDEAGKGPTLYLGDIWLEGADAPPASVGAAAGPPVAYRIQGMVGNLKVDLTVTPIPLTPAAAPPAKPVRGDPARLERIRSTKMPPIDKPILFDTPEADAIVSALEVFPPDNPWNLVVSDWPVHPNSKNIVAAIGADKPFRANPDMGYILVPPNQKRVDVKIVAYPGESDKGPFPVPDNLPIEGWPVEFLGPNGPKLSLEDVQRDKLKKGGDRHALIVDPVNRMLYELYQAKKTDSGWQAAQTSIFDLKSNKLRPESWTSADAAGLPIFPATVRYDELKRGAIEHALRVTVPRSRKEYVYPATHQAGHGTEPNLPRMGERLRLKQDFDITPFSPEVQTILKALKKYGMFVADNGISWAISVAPDPRIPVLHSELRKIPGSAFEVIEPPAGYQPPRE